MIKLTLLLALVSCASARTLWHQLEPTRYDFSKYVAEFNKPYTTEHPEYALRKGIFDSNLALITAHNRLNHTWKNGVNHLTDRTPDELRKLRGFKRSLAHLSHAEGKSPLHVNTGKAVPTSVDWRTIGAVSAVKDQGQCGSCWTFATAESIESQWFLKYGEMSDLSEQQVASCTSNPHHCGGTGGCAGGTMEVAYKSIIAMGGIASEWTYPYLSWSGENFACRFKNATERPLVKLAGYRKIATNSYEDFLDAVANVGPLAISVDASTWHMYESGVYNGCNQTNPTIDHAVQVVGYGVDDGVPYWTVRNSWTPNFGEDGFIRVYRNDKPICGTDLDPSQGEGCDNGPSSIEVCGTCGILFDNAYPIIADKN